MAKADFLREWQAKRMTSMKVSYKFGVLVLAGLLGGGVGWGVPAAAGTATPEGCRALRLHGKKVEATACFEALARSGDAYRMAEGDWGREGYRTEEHTSELQSP